ncbi:MAG: response regulator transcription factor [Clostridia bacterium]|nr:response regulator transcription factor [Clostridia bacterium]
MAVVLVVEDNKNTQLLTATRLRPYFEVVCADDGLDALDIFYARHIDLVISDIMMPNMDGFELLERIRSEGFNTPVLLLTAKQDMKDKREGFSLGTDDYVTKPVDYDELLLRVNALLRRARIATERQIKIGKLSIDEAEHIASYDGEAIAFSRKEFDLLYKFLSYPGKIFTKKQLLDEIWGIDSECTEDTIKTHINRLRNKLVNCEEIEIVTIKGFGYKVEIKK